MQMYPHTHLLFLVHIHRHLSLTAGTGGWLGSPESSSTVAWSGLVNGGGGGGADGMRRAIYLSELSESGTDPQSSPNNIS